MRIRRLIHGSITMRSRPPAQRSRPRLPASAGSAPLASCGRRGITRRGIERALEKLLLAKPGLLLVSAGFDAYSGDPLTEMTLEREDFASFGEWLRKIDIPTAAILEGGYSDDLPELIDAFLTAWVT